MSTFGHLNGGGTTCRQVLAEAREVGSGDEHRKRVASRHIEIDRECCFSN